MLELRVQRYEKASEIQRENASFSFYFRAKAVARPQVKVRLIIQNSKFINSKLLDEGQTCGDLKKDGYFMWRFDSMLKTCQICLHFVFLRVAENATK